MNAYNSRVGMRRWTVGVLSLALLTLCGCVGDSAFVTGQVTLDGQPLADAEVVFHPADTTADVSPYGGRSGPDGKFTLQVGADRKGPPPGSYKVIVTRYVLKDGSTPSVEDLDQFRLMGKVKNMVPAIYDNLERTPLTVEVKAGTNDIPVMLKKKP